MNNKQFEIFIESFRNDKNNELIDTLMEGFNLIYQPQTEGIGDTFRDAKNRIKTIGATGKEALFGASEEQSFKNIIARTVLNKKLYDSNSRMGHQAINEIVKLISHGTRDSILPSKIANIADNVLANCIENAIASNPNVSVTILEPSELRYEMDIVFDEIAESVINPLETLGEMRLNDDRVEFVSLWWDKHVVTKMGKYFDALNTAQLKITPKNTPAPRKQTPRKQTPRKRATKKSPFPPPPEDE